MNLDFASVWEMVADLVPENDALICGEDIVSWKDYDLRSSKVSISILYAIKYSLQPITVAPLFLLKTCGPKSGFQLGLSIFSAKLPLTIDHVSS